MPTSDSSAVLAAVVERIRVVRGARVLFDTDLVALYGVTAKQFGLMATSPKRQ